MNTDETKTRIRKGAEQLENGVAAAAESLADGAEALGEKSDELQEKLRDIGRRLLETSKELGDEAAKQARLRPLSVVGIAFVAGLVVARALRR